MLGITRCPLYRQEQELYYSIAEGRWTSPRGNAHGFYAIAEYTKRENTLFLASLLTGSLLF